MARRKHTSGCSMALLRLFCNARLRKVLLLQEVVVLLWNGKTTGILGAEAATQPRHDLLRHSDEEQLAVKQKIAIKALGMRNGAEPLGVTFPSSSAGDTSRAQSPGVNWLAVPVLLICVTEVWDHAAHSHLSHAHGSFLCFGCLGAVWGQWGTLQPANPFLGSQHAGCVSPSTGRQPIKAVCLHLRLLPCSHWQISAIHIYDSIYPRTLGTGTKAFSSVAHDYIKGASCTAKVDPRHKCPKQRCISQQQYSPVTAMWKRKAETLMKGRSAGFALRCLLQANWQRLPRALLKVSFIWVSLKCASLFTYIQPIQSKLNFKLVLEGILENTSYAEMNIRRKTGLENSLLAALTSIT